MCNEKTFSVKEITLSDVSLIKETAKVEAENFSEPMSEKTLTDSLTSPYFRLYAAVNEKNELLAYVALGRILPELQINSIASVKKRRGYGKKLLTEVLDREKAEGTEKVTLEVRVSNLPAIELYKSLGFTVTAERKNLYDKPRENGLGMILEFK